MPKKVTPSIPLKTATPPASMITIDSTEEKIGRSMKKRESWPWMILGVRTGGVLRTVYGPFREAVVGPAAKLGGRHKCLNTRQLHRLGYST